MAAKEIRSRIVESVEHVAVGSPLVAEAASTMGEVMWVVSEVTSSLRQISSTLAEQSVGVEELNHAIVNASAEPQVRR